MVICFRNLLSPKTFTLRKNAMATRSMIAALAA